MKAVFISLVVIIVIAGGVWLGRGSDSGKTEESPSPTPAPAGTMIKLENGLQYEDVVVGTGAEAKAGMAVAVHYTGTFQDGTKFDSSVDRGEPFAFKLGAGQVIEGWDLGVAGMKVGGKRKLVIPGNLAYGDGGAPARDDQGRLIPGKYVIPPNATLLFDVELLAVQEVQDSE